MFLQLRLIYFSLTINSLLMFSSCNDKAPINTEKSINKAVILDVINIDSNLRNSSNDFIRRNKITFGNIEVDIDKKEYRQTYLTFITRGIADFAVRKSKPLFTYQIEDNLFFVFTGAEDLLSIPFDESKYSNRRQGRYDSIIKAWYVFEDYKMRREDSCTLSEPFSNLKPTLPPPPIHSH